MSCKFVLKQIKNEITSHNKVSIKGCIFGFPFKISSLREPLHEVHNIFLFLTDLTSEKKVKNNAYIKFTLVLYMNF